jgi:hypothetical protein
MSRTFGKIGGFIYLFFQYAPLLLTEVGAIDQTTTCADKS